MSGGGNSGDPQVRPVQSMQADEGQLSAIVKRLAVLDLHPGECAKTAEVDEWGVRVMLFGLFRHLCSDDGDVIATNSYEIRIPATSQLRSNAAQTARSLLPTEDLAPFARFASCPR